MRFKITGLLALLLLITLSGLAQSSETLTDKQLTEYENEGIKKLQDFYDYLGVISNQTYEKDMRENAKIQATRLFYGTDCFIDGKKYKSYIDSCFSAKNRIQWKAINFSIKEKMKAKSDVLDSEYYEGTVTFTLSGTDGKQRIAHILLTKGKKSRGISNRETWTALIANIR